MTEGELLSLESQGRSALSAQEYFRIIDRKTAELFAAGAALPALIQPARPAAADALERYGRALGTCFQLIDDLLDFTARETDLGKPVLSDLKEGKLTLPLILALERVDPSRRRWVESVLEDRAFSRTTPEQILELVQSEGTLDEVREMAATLAAEASGELEPLPPCGARDALEAAPHFVLHRRR
jgi:octaprenyl-diphosphate synthase